MRKLYLTGAAAVVTLTAAAFALPSAKPSKMDADGNGVVTKAEAMTAADTMFAKMDVNNDGAINVADREAKIKEHFQEMDADKNGSISEAEFLAAHKERMEDRMADRSEMRDERDGDGPRHGRHGGGRHGGPDSPGGGHGMAMLQNADANKDMAVTKAEMRAAAEARFAKADTNKDGSLSADEQKAARKAMRDQRGDLPPPPKA